MRGDTEPGTSSFLLRGKVNWKIINRGHTQQTIIVSCYLYRGSTAVVSGRVSHGTLLLYRIIRYLLRACNNTTWTTIIHTYYKIQISAAAAQSSTAVAAWLYLVPGGLTTAVYFVYVSYHKEYSVWYMSFTSIIYTAVYFLFFWRRHHQFLRLSRQDKDQEQIGDEPKVSVLCILVSVSCF